MSFDCPPWNPETDPVLLALLGKFIEELSECSHMAARCLIQGIGEVEPVTFLPNRGELEKEIADVLATAELVCINLRLDRRAMQERQISKMSHLDGWHARLRKDQANGSPLL